jgi:integrase
MQTDRLPQSGPESAGDFWRVYELRETGKPLRHELAVWVAPGVRRKMRIPAAWTARPVAERAQFADGAARRMRDLHEQENPVTPKSTEPTAVTFDEFARLWTSGDLNRRYPGHVKRKKTAGDDEHKLEVMKPWIGAVPLKDFRVEHAEQVLQQLSETVRAPATLRGYAQVIHRVLALAVYPGKPLSFNPLPEGFLPSSGPPKAKSFVYPSEDSALLRCRDAVPVARRCLYGFLAREGLRLSEALGLRWADLDLERGTLSLDENKTDDPRTWALDAGVARALKAWRRISTADLDGRHERQRLNRSVFPLPMLDVESRKFASVFRADLEAAGVTRPALFVRSETRLPIRVHDLRASFVTLALANGKTEAWVTDRTGHRSSAMVAAYKRQTRTATELALGWFAPLDKVIPELAQAAEPSGSEPPTSRDSASESVAVSRSCLDSNVSAHADDGRAEDSPNNSALVREEGLEPPRLAALEPKSSASANSATRAMRLEAPKAASRATRV